ncbi:MAG TPA: MraY family glycosyltransferase [Polyangiales bacterium]|nr:MraY family glycosyltransferase [Polyangiales bacterium]
MLSSVFVFAGSMLVAIMTTPVVRTVALRLGAIDRPGDRRVHGRVTPRLGGIAILLGFFAPILALFAAQTAVADLFFAQPSHFLGLIAGGLLVCALGALDDLRGVRAWHKLWVQCAAACTAYACGFRIDAIKLPFIGDLQMGSFGIVVTALWIVAIVNAINLIDGLDGLAGGVAFFACVTNFVVGAINHDVIVMLLSASLGGAALGFLLFNFSPASIFMGDSGSMFLGFVLATTSILGNSVKSSTTVAILVPFVALGLPIIDTLLAMMRRVLEHRSIFSADRGHIHHQLLAMGLTHRRAVLLLYGLSVLFTASAIIVSVGRNTAVGACLIVITIAAVGIVRSLGNLENALQRWLRKERIRPAVIEHLRSEMASALERIAATREPSEIVAVLEDFGAHVQLEVVEYTGPSEGPLESFYWAKDRPTPKRLEAEAFTSVTASFAVPSLGGVLHFSWASDTGHVLPEADILLQLVADAVENRIKRAAEANRPSSHLRSV